MSYIRSLSNPEGLYIWHDINGSVAIARPNLNTIYYPYDKFNEFFQQFIKNCDETFDEFPFCLNGLEVWEDSTKNFLICLAVPQNGKIEKIYMYKVTWNYIVSGFKYSNRFNFIQKIIWIFKNWWKIGKV